MKPNTLIKSLLCISLVLIGVVFSEFLNMFGVTETQTIESALDNSKFLPKEISLGLNGLVAVLGVYLIYLIISIFDIKSKKESQSLESGNGKQ